jgi:hypothetical protein
MAETNKPDHDDANRGVHWLPYVESFVQRDELRNIVAVDLQGLTETAFQAQDNVECLQGLIDQEMNVLAFYEMVKKQLAYGTLPMRSERDSIDMNKASASWSPKYKLPYQVCMETMLSCPSSTMKLRWTKK